MRKHLNRRDFLKLASMLPAAFVLPPRLIQPTDPESPNIIILVFDAWSASNTSLYGYPRETMPFLSQLADKAIVYHNHYAGGHWTYPGTASLLTGVHPWTHRGYSRRLSISEPYDVRNIFGLFDSHFRNVYTHNTVADGLIQKLVKNISHYKPRQELYVNDDFWLAKIFGKDYDIASTAWVRALKKLDDGYANSLFLSRLYALNSLSEQKEIQKVYPRGLPSVEGDNYFLLETAIDWIAEQSSILPAPYLGYYHLLPPHAPYRTRRDFTSTFYNDDFRPVHKPKHPISSDLPNKRLDSRRVEYDEFILLVDSEINRLYSMLAEQDALENTWLIITSDHGEMFERGILGHVEPTFHKPLMQVPLLIFPPGQQKRVDIHTPTSAIDLLPTLLHVSGKPIPEWLQGKILPPYYPNSNADRPIYAMDARFSKSNAGPFTSGTVMLVQDDYKLTYFFGNEGKYEPLNGEAFYELYDIKNDPEELENIFDQQPVLAETMLNSILSEMKKYGAL
jgi:arylsulfatase A-like enzyme